MSTGVQGSAVEAAIEAATRLRALLTKGKHRQVRSSDERAAVKAAVHTWFKVQRPTLPAHADPAEMKELDRVFALLMEWTERNIARRAYVIELASLKRRLVQLRSVLLVQPGTKRPPATQPDFTRLISDPAMVAILVRRWEETWACLRVDAYLAATVMMGGLLEGLLLARINAMQVTAGGMAPAFRAAAAPKEPGGKTKQLKEWGLKDYIDVAHELRWIAASAKDVSVVLRDYRNYIHPQKELSHAIVVDKRETDILASVFMTVTDQILASA